MLKPSGRLALSSVLTPSLACSLFPPGAPPCRSGVQRKERAEEKGEGRGEREACPFELLTFLGDLDEQAGAAQEQRPQRPQRHGHLLGTAGQAPLSEAAAGEEGTEVGGDTGRGTGRAGKDR